MAATQEKATPCCLDAAPAKSSALLRKASDPMRDWTVSGSDPSQDPIRNRAAVPTLIRPIETLPATSTNTTAAKGRKNILLFYLLLWVQFFYIYLLLLLQITILLFGC